MLEQWEADHLLSAPKIYSIDMLVEVGRGADNDYQVETDDGLEFFLLDVRGPTRDPERARFQLRYKRDIVLARLCMKARHTNPDGQRFDGPHLHIYQEGFDAKIAEAVGPFDSIEGALISFCRRINLVEPTIQGGLS